VTTMINCEAIMGSDHMTNTPESHDPDGWFRQTITMLTEVLHPTELKLERITECLRDLEQLAQAQEDAADESDNNSAYIVARAERSLAQELLTVLA